MTREQLREMGLTDEQVDTIMKEHGTAIQREKDKATKYKEKAERTDELENQLDAINKEKMSDIEKANAEKDEALKLYETEKAKNRNMELKTSLADAGITGESADKLIASFGNGTLDVDVLKQIITDNRTDAANAKLKEIQDGQINPGNASSNNNNQGKNLSLAEKLATQIQADKVENNNVLSQYID